MPLSPDKYQKIIDALRENPNASDVARQLGGVSHETVRKIAGKEGIGLSKRNRVTPEQREQIIAALATTKNARLVARQVGGVSGETVRTIAREEKITLNAPGNPIPAQTREEITLTLSANANATDVSRRFDGVSRGTVANVARAAGIELTGGRGSKGLVKVPEDKRQQIITALNGEANSKKVAMETGVSQSTVWTIAQQEGIKLPPRGNPLSALKREEIKAALHEHPNANRIAKQAGISTSTVWKVAKQEGIELTAGKAARGSRPPIPKNPAEPSGPPGTS